MQLKMSAGVRLADWLVFGGSHDFLQSVSPDSLVEGRPRPVYKSKHDLRASCHYCIIIHDIKELQHLLLSYKRNPSHNLLALAPPRFAHRYTWRDH